MKKKIIDHLKTREKPGEKLEKPGHVLNFGWTSAAGGIFAPKMLASWRFGYGATTTVETLLCASPWVTVSFSLPAGASDGIAKLIW